MTEWMDGASGPAATDLAYIAGYFDGDGGFNTPLVRQRDDMGIGHVVRASVFFDTTDLDTLRWVFDTLKAAGMVGGHYLNTPRHTSAGNAYGCVRFARLDDVRLFCELVGPYLIAKRAQMEIIRDELLPLLIGKGRRRWTRAQLLSAVQIKERIDALKQCRSLFTRFGPRLQDDGTLKPWPTKTRSGVAS